MSNFKQIFSGISREPVLFFGLIGLYIAAYQPTLIDTDAKKAFVGGVVLFLQRAYSTPTSTVNTQTETARYTGALEHQTVSQAGQILANTIPVYPGNSPMLNFPVQTHEPTEAERTGIVVKDPSTMSVAMTEQPPLP